MLTNRRRVRIFNIRGHNDGRERQVRIDLLNIRSVAKKTDDVRELFQTHHPDVLALNEAWHEDTDCLAIKRLRTLGLDVIEAARPIPSKAERDTVGYVNRGGVASFRRRRVSIAKINVALEEFQPSNIFDIESLRRESP